MAEKKITRVESTKEETKKSGLNIDLGDLKKIGLAILAFLAANPELTSKLLKKPAAYIKKIIKGEDVSDDTKKTVNKTIKSSSGSFTDILSSLTSLGGGNSEINDIFGKIKTTVTGAKVAEAAGVDVGGLIGGLFGGSSSTKSRKKSTKKSSSSSGNVLGDIFKSIFK